MNWIEDVINKGLPAEEGMATKRRVTGEYISLEDIEKIANSIRQEFIKRLGDRKTGYIKGITRDEWLKNIGYKEKHDEVIKILESE